MIRGVPLPSVVSDEAVARVPRRSFCLPVSLSAVTHAQHTHRVFVEFKAKAIIADPEAVLGRIDALEFSYVPGSGGSESLDCVLDFASDSFIEIGHIVQSCLSPLNLHQ